MNGVVKAAADDVAYASSSILEITRVMVIVNKFREVSGLGINENKTVILRAIPTTQEQEWILAKSAWPEAVFVDEQIYIPRSHFR